MYIYIYIYIHLLPLVAVVPLQHLAQLLVVQLLDVLALQY